MSDPIRNAIARINATPKVDLPGMSPETSEILLLRGRLDAAQGEIDALLRGNRESRTELNAEIDRLRAELAGCCTQRDEAQRRCAEMEGKMASAEKPEAPEPDDEYEVKYEALVAEHTDLRVMHGACAAKEAGLNQVITELRRANETMQAQIQACMVEEPEEPEEEEDSESGCEIEVVRGSDDRIRSMRVRYT
jgi:peptidoglycan hydrolase CwlO-like protein